MEATLAYPGGHSGSPTAVPSPASSVKPLWAAVGVLSVCVLAMGASLVYVSNRSEPVAQTTTTASTLAPMPLAATGLSGLGQDKTQDMVKEMPIAPAADKSTEKAPLTEKKSAPVAIKKVVNKAPAQASASASAHTSANTPANATANSTANAPAPVVVASAEPAVAQPAPAVVKPVCSQCGRIESVTPVTRQGQGSGVGVVAGGVLGGVVGNQFGKGNGRAAMTVLGAVGGGIAGNAIEKNMKKTTVYSVTVRMEDGSLRIVEQATAPTVGSKVTLENGNLRPV